MRNCSHPSKYDLVDPDVVDSYDESRRNSSDALLLVSLDRCDDALTQAKVMGWHCASTAAVLAAETAHPCARWQYGSITMGLLRDPLTP